MPRGHSSSWQWVMSSYFLWFYNVVTDSRDDPLLNADCLCPQCKPQWHGWGTSGIEFIDGALQPQKLARLQEPEMPKRKKRQGMQLRKKSK
jgi:hypothetical protein